MTEKEIKIYLEAFWKGESTQEQEEALKTFFANTKIPQSFDQDRSYFEYIVQEQKKGISNPNFDDQLMQKIHHTKVRKMWYGVLKIAAGIAIFGATAWFYHTQQISVSPIVTDLNTTLLHKSDSQQLAKDALLLLSKGINQDSTHEAHLQEFKQQLQDFTKKQHKPSIAP